MCAQLRKFAVLYIIDSLGPLPPPAYGVTLAGQVGRVLVKKVEVLHRTKSSSVVLQTACTTKLNIEAKITFFFFGNDFVVIC